MHPSSEWHCFPQCPPYYLTPSPVAIFSGPSQLLGSGLGLFAFPPSQDLLPGTVVTEYFGQSTANGGLPISHLTASHPSGRADGGYLLQSGDYMVDCDPHCPGGYLNDPFCPGNCFFQPAPDNPHRLLVVLRVTL